VTVGSVLFYLIVGTVVGLMGKFVAPRRRDDIPLWLTVLCGIGGMVLGGLVYRYFGGDGSRGLDWTQGLVAVLTAAVLVVVSSAVAGHGSRRRR
jgi:uncharacterized membrane protein YeaQ/YmgE (transglycosylase-associated protein family)